MAREKKGMKILLYVDCLDCGGMERQVVEIVAGLVRSGRVATGNIMLVCMQEHGFYDAMIESLGMKIVRLVRSMRWDPLVPFRLKRIIASFNPDIIHTFGLMTSFYASLTPMPENVKFIEGSIQNAFPPLTLKERILGSLVFSRADVVVGNTQAGLVAKKAPLAKSAVLHNGFDFSRVASLKPPGAVKNDLGIKTTFAVGMTASFAKNKDWETFLKAARIVCSRNPDVSFVAVGSGELLPFFRDSFKDIPSVVFTGLRHDVEDIDNLCDVGVLCSNPDVHKEGIPNAVMEFMALAKPVVCTEGDGTRELVVDGVTGFMIPPKAPDALAERILELLTDKEKAKEMGRKGRERIMERFSLEAMTATLCGIYERVLQAT